MSKHIPSLHHDIVEFEVIQRNTFSFPITEFFEPQDGTLNFNLEHPIVSWLHVDKQLGILHGVAPRVTYTKKIPVEIKAYNKFGAIKVTFILKIIDTEVVDTMTNTLEHILSLQKQKSQQSHLQIQLHELSEYIYAFYSQDAYKDLFEKSLREAAKENNINLSKKITYHDFKSLMHAINPGFENSLQALSKESKLLTETELNNHEFRNLFRQGGQATGTVTIPVWNHFASPNLHNWSGHNPIANVLDAATEQIHKLKQQNKHLNHLNKGPKLKP